MVSILSDRALEYSTINYIEPDLHQGINSNKIHVTRYFMPQMNDLYWTSTAIKSIKSNNLDETKFHPNRLRLAAQPTFGDQILNQSKPLPP